MPTLHWIGKDKVINHHLDVPYRVLDHQYGFENGEQSEKETNSGNKIIHGDNLEALKSLLPEYEGKIKCIYIDPPYNTGNEGWVYNDNVNDPKIKKWLHEVVGKEGEDLSRHDKWLCMMYPRLKLLHKLLKQEGVIFISIDDNEQANLKLTLDEIFGAKNLITNFTWKTDGNFDNQAKVKINHEYILAYAKNIDLLEHPNVIDPNIGKESKLFKSEIRNTIVKNGPKNPISEIILPIGFPASFEEGIIKARSDSWPHYLSDAVIKDSKLQNSIIVKSGWSSKAIAETFINNNLNPVKDSKGQDTIFQITSTGAIENVKIRSNTSHVVSSLQNMGNTQNMSSELKSIGINFDYPKPVTLIQYLLSLINTDGEIVLDSFAGSGTTAHAVLNLNNLSGKRNFILIEMMSYVETITIERIKNVINGYGERLGVKGNFDYYNLGQSLFNENNELNEGICLNKLRNYIYFTETHHPLNTSTIIDNEYFLDIYNQTSYYFYYKVDELTALDDVFLGTIKTKAEQYIIYADNCLLNADFMKKHNIIFKKIPRDITKF
ncbi:adenine-specific DNA-methyltransferase [Mucilaginibacter frigoritolerans]|uniref:site-specific DNA-methyltransferase (adenine-specific) n=1 Tax=Mucilaginibacter frigoritolerans TaxID=652788 RepID=A0A562U985_9SPHI|nr:site-specific DNA-methyltransferase [Mucilaginibacter frigoritolerans]TWJ02372.1 adenine-specific DNA-methyltransferase [Mucilaginibacter frigoritolerans]